MAQVGILSTVHLPKPAFSDFLQNLVMANGRTIEPTSRNAVALNVTRGGGTKATKFAVIYSMRSQVRVVVTSSPPGGAVNIRRLPMNL